MKNSRIGNAFPMGATVIGKKTVQFVSLINTKKETSLVLCDKKTGIEEEYKLTKEFSIGNLYSIIIEDLEPANYTYFYLENGKKVIDPYAKVICGNEVWGSEEEKSISAGIKIDNFKWDEDRGLMYPYEKSVIYQLHVRGFTKHISSNVRKKGTYEGLCEKIPYLKDLGITCIELLPSYEFMECEKVYPKKNPTMEYVKENFAALPEEQTIHKINYWGFKEAYYFAPKASYSASKNAINSFKNMVKEFHKSGIEVMMQFYFPQSISSSYIVEVIKYWVKEFHIDGVRLLGVNLPVSVLATQPELLNTKILYDNINFHEIYDYQYLPAYKNLATYNDGYMYAVRRFLKGDVGSLHKAFQAMAECQKQIGNTVYLTNYNTFTLKDLVSFDRKHNEDNGEHGRDGNNNNLSWNCGIEGPTKKKQILQIREKQMRNAIAFLMLSKGTPVLVAGDEFGNSQNGNNNPYCQDNAITWINWKDLDKHQEHFNYTKKMISFMKEFAWIKNNSESEKRKTALEYPFMSYHGSDAWKLDFSEANEEAGGILYYKDYTYLYIGINMHWQENLLSLPNIPGKHRWTYLVDTSMKKEEGVVHENIRNICMPPRSIRILIAKGSKDDFNDESLSAF